MRRMGPGPCARVKVRHCKREGGMQRRVVEGAEVYCTLQYGDASLCSGHNTRRKPEACQGWGPCTVL